MTLKQPSPPANLLYPELLRYLQERAMEFQAIPSDRKPELTQVSDYDRERLAKSEPAKLTFICTHNSRRSHHSQIWAQVAAEHYGLVGVVTFSGGTEATAFDPRAVAAMQRCGLKFVTDDAAAANLRYSVYTSEVATPQVCFSKVCAIFTWRQSTSSKTQSHYRMI